MVYVLAVVDLVLEGYPAVLKMVDGCSCCPHEDCKQCSALHAAENVQGFVYAKCECDWLRRWVACCHRSRSFSLGSTMLALRRYDLGSVRHLLVEVAQRDGTVLRKPGRSNVLRDDGIQ